MHLLNNYYSLPSNLIGKEVTVRWDSSLVRIVYAGEQVALHLKAKGIGSYVTQRVHLPDYKVYSQTEYQKRYEEKMANIGEKAHQYFRFLLKSRERYWFRPIRAILGYAQEYGNEAVNLTLKRAMYYQASDLTTLKNILERKLYLLPSEPKLLNQRALQIGPEPANGQISQAGNTEQSALFRDLTYYIQTERSTS